MSACLFARNEKLKNFKKKTNKKQTTKYKQQTINLVLCFKKEETTHTKHSHFIKKEANNTTKKR